MSAKKSSKTETKAKKAKPAETALPETTTEPQVESPEAAATDGKPAKKSGKKSVWHSNRSAS